MGSKAGSGTQGYMYSLGIFMGICRGAVNEIVEIRAGDLTAWFGSVMTNATFGIDAPWLFGGPLKEGGIVGEVQAYFGGDTQVLSDDLKASLNGSGLVATVPIDSGTDSNGLPIPDPSPVTSAPTPGGIVNDGTDPLIIPIGTGLVPAYRGVTTLYYNGQITANTPYLKTWKIRTRRYTAGWDGGPWYPEKCPVPMVSGQQGTGPDIIAMNGAHIVYECATNSMWGRGMDRALIDDFAFRVAADRLFIEGFGICLRWSRQNTVSEFMQQIVDHIGAAFYIDRTTGLFVLKLIRDDYDATTLPVFDKNSGLLEITDDTAGSQDTSANEIIVQYHDPIRDQDRETRAQNLASLQSIGTIISNTVSYPGIPTPDLASRVALRDLKVQANSLKRYTVKLDRSGWRLEPASVFRVHDLSRNIDNIVLRVVKVEDSNHGGGDGTITLTCLQDVFGMPDTGFVGVQQTLWQPPNNVPVVPSRRLLYEATYRDLVRSLSVANLAAVDNSSGAIVSVASKPSATSAMYRLLTKTGTEAFVDHTLGPWSPSARFHAAVGVYDTTLTLDRGSNLAQLTCPCALFVGGEIMGLTALNLTTGVATVLRGCADTIPVAHAVDAFVFFPDFEPVTDGREYLDTEVVSAKILTVTTTTTLDESVAPTDTVTINRRHFRPYPPGKLKVDGVRFGEITPTGEPPGDRVLTWAHRDRLTQLDVLTDHGTGDVGPEAGTTYVVRIYHGTTNTLLRTTSGITAATWTYTTVMQAADSAPHKVRAEVNSVRDGLTSFQIYSFFMYLAEAGFGFGWDYSWGVRP